ncbi:solute carrier family 35 member G1-like [Diadema antillarum]|uniref:solute carrier family 35 member G1-like n=1 Tax=Diadema antillarum TaxID=105358 RepID=UPI003A857CDA
MAMRGSQTSSARGWEKESPGEVTPLNRTNDDHPADSLDDGAMNSRRTAQGMADKRSQRRFVSTLLRNRGLILAVISVFLMSFLSLVSKLLARGIPVNQLVFVYSLAMAVFSAPIVIWQRLSFRSLSRKTWLFLVLRSVAGNFATICFFQALHLLDISTAKSIMYSSPLFTGIFARMCLKERCSIIRAVCSCITVFGVVLVVQPSAIFDKIFGSSDDTTKNSPVGIVFAILNAISVAVVYISLRVLGRLETNSQTVLFVYGAISGLISVAVTTAFDEWTLPRCGSDRLLLLAFMAMGYLEMMTLVLALQTVNAASVAVIRATDVFIIFVIDIAILHVIPNYLTVIGALCVVGSSLTISVLAYFNTRSARD